MSKELNVSKLILDQKDQIATLMTGKRGKNFITK
jgi:hypothetical protein